MTLKKKLYISTIISLILVILSFIFKDAQSELPLFLNLLLGCVILYTSLFYLFQKGIFKTKWINRTEIVIAYIFSMCLLGYGIIWANKTDQHQDSFWVINGNIWLTDVLASIMTLLTFYVIFSWLFGQWKKIQLLKNEKSKAELALLKNQINPHFFFNTLNNLYSLIKKDPDLAQEYVLKLSDMMRFTIYDGKEENVTCHEEIKYLTNFIELQTGRYHKIIDIRFTHDIKNKNCTLPPLLLIILVENAFKHGVEKMIDGAFIHLELFENDNHMIFKIKNNFDPDNAANEHGIGLKNLKGRLELLFPKKHKLTIVNTNNIYSAELKLNKV